MGGTAFNTFYLTPFPFNRISREDFSVPPVLTAATSFSLFCIYYCTSAACWYLKTSAQFIVCNQWSNISLSQSVRPTGYLINTYDLLCPITCAEPQKRRRFNALKNLRRIFRRRTVASAETLPSKGKIRSHIAPVELEDGHFRDSFNAYKQPSLVSIRSTQDDEQTRHRSTTLDYAQGGAGSGHSRHRSGGGQRTRHAEDYSFDDCRTRRDHRHSHKLSVSALDRVSVQQIHVNDGISSPGTSDWTNGAHKRSHSEDRLKEG